MTNPTVVVEVPWKSTEAYDRGDKLAGYLALPSVQHVVLVSQRERRVETYMRREDLRPGAVRRRVRPPR